MQSPFPGMDPYLEGSEWQSFHSAFALEIARQLSGKLPDAYVARPEKDLILDEIEGVSIVSSGMIRPDTSLVAEPKSVYSTGSAPVLDRPLKRSIDMPRRVPHHFVEIYSVEGFELVTAIEVLSPANKRGEGRDEYLAKRYRIVASYANLVERS